MLHYQIDPLASTRNSPLLKFKSLEKFFQSFKFNSAHPDHQLKSSKSVIYHYQGCLYRLDLDPSCPHLSEIGPEPWIGLEMGHFEYFCGSYGIRIS